MKTLPLTMALPLALCPSVDAAIIAADDFSSPTSGTGWAAGDSWENLSNGTAVAPGNSFRAFETPFNAGALDKLYFAFDYTQASDGQAWGGASFFSGASGGNEMFFMGDPGAPGFDRYGIDGKSGFGPSVDSGIDITAGATVRLIAELDFNAEGTQSIYRMWVNSIDVNNPTATSSPGNSPLGTISSIRFGNDGGVGQSTFDNLIVATTAEEVGLVPEPGSFVLVSLAGAMLGLRRRRS